MRAVRVALDVGVRVVLAMVGDPVEHRPCTDSEPRIAKVRSSHAYVWNARWVSMRWKPKVTPPAVSRYIAAMIPRSVQSTRWFHSSTIAASTPRNGTTTPPGALRSRRTFPSVGARAVVALRRCLALGLDFACGRGH